MKFKNILIILIAILMVFVFASCKNEPASGGEPTPNPDPEQVIDDPSVLEPFPWGDSYIPTENTVYEITVEDGVDGGYWSNDKIKVQFKEAINAGDTITLKYRSERTIYQWDIRDSSNVKWVYESKKNGFVDPVLGDGGWYTLTYTFGNDINGDPVSYPYSTFSIYFRGAFVEGDVFELMDISVTHKEAEGPDTVKALTIDEDNVISGNTELSDTIVDHKWTKPRTYAVILATDTLGEVEKTPIVLKVNAGDAIDFSAPDLSNLSVFFDLAKTEPYYKSWKVLEDGLILYYQGE